MSYNHKVLYLEDSYADAELVRNVLVEGHIHFDFLTVASEDDFVKALVDFSPDIVLSDHSLPGFNSFEAFSILKANHLQIPFIVITATMTEELAMAIVREGADDYIMKDRLNRLPHAISNALDKHRFETNLKKLIYEAHNKEIATNDSINKLAKKILLATSVAGIGIWEYLVKEKQFIADDVLLRHYGLPIDEYNVSYEEIMECVHPDDREKANQEFIDTLSGNADFETEHRVIWKDGTTHYIKIIAVLQRDASADPVRLIGTSQDITEQIQFEIKLRKDVLQHSLFETIIHSSDDAIISKTLGSIITSWNHGAEVLFEYSAKETIGKNISIIIPDDLIEDEKIIVSTVKNGNHVRQYETERIRKDGSRIDVSLTLSPLLNGSGAIIGVSKIVRDITERKKSQRQMKNLTDRLLMATSSANMGIWDWDIENNYLQWDEGMHKIYKTRSLEFESVYDSWLTRLHPEDKTGVDEEIQSAIMGKKGYNTEFRIVWDDLSVHYIRATGLLEFSESGIATRMIGLNWDVTERRLSEIRLGELNKNIIKHAKELAESNAELEQFAYVASHDLQEPLRMVTTYLTQIERKYGAIIDEKGKKYINFAVDGAKRMRLIILDLLEFSRVGRSDDVIEDIDLNELVKEIELLFNKQIEEKKATIISDNLPTVPFHRTPLRQVFQNLISNALKYSREGIPAKIRVTVVESINHWQFSIIDNGIGIEKQYYSKVFEIFQRLHNKDEFSGTGIGLAIAKKIIENMGGEIWIESQEGNGTTFLFTLLKEQ